MEAKIIRRISDEKRSALLKSAEELFAEKGYYETSVKDITERSAVSVGTFYIYFKNKDEILLSLYRNINCSVKELISKETSKVYKNNKDKLISCTIALIKFYIRHENLSLLLLTKPIGMNETFEHEFFDLFGSIRAVFSSIINALHSDGLLDFPDIDTASTAYIHILNGLTATWLAYRDGTSAESLINNIIIYNFRALNIEFQQSDINSERE